jgi:glycosyltransferase involved in cell wall biosynthesis
MTRPTVVIIQPYVPAYRVAFFERLTDALASHDIDLVVAAGDPTGQQALRADSATFDNGVTLTERRLRVGSRALRLRRIGPVIRGAHLVVLEQAVGNLEAYPLLFGRRGGPLVALWGHGRTYSKPVSRMEAQLKDCLTCRADWFFAYTQAGAERVAASGFPRHRITVVHNTYDTEPVVRARKAWRGREDEIRWELGLTGRNVGLFVGGLDASKRMGFLLESALRVRQEVDDFVLLVAGRGEQEGLVRDAAARHEWIRWVGYANAETKARLAAVSSLMLIPGRVGLVAIDSIVLGLPLVANDWPYHSPEFENLVDGRNCLVTPDTIDDYACGVVALLRDDAARHRIASHCARDAALFSLDVMVENFVRGVRAALVDAVRAHRREELTR